MDRQLGAEICVGMVLHLDPKQLLGAGAKVTGEPGRWVVGHHFFLCIEAGAKLTRWVPLFSEAGAKRESIAAEGRQGHPKWTGGTFHFHPEQVWTASRHAVVRAAAAAGDLSVSGQRNLLRAELAPRP